MDTPTLVASSPPHGDVDLDRVADLLRLDVFVTRLKVKFAAPEVLAATGEWEASELASALRHAGLSVAVLDGARLADPPWPEPISTLAIDESGLRATVRDGTVQVSRDAEVTCVYCRPPSGFNRGTSVDLGQAVLSAHGPTIAEAIQWRSVIDLYAREGESLLRLTIVPDLLDLDGDSVVNELAHRLRHVRLDTRLAGVRPRARFVMGEAGFNPDQRKKYSFGTLLLCHVLESISPELRNIPHWEFGSRLAYALDPPGAGAE